MIIYSRLSLTVLTLLAAPSTSFAACGYVKETGKIVACGAADTLTVGAIIIAITNWILGIGGAIAVLFIIWGGILYLTAAGNEKQVASAKLTLTNAIIGLVIILLAYVIMQLVVSAAQFIT